MLFNSKPFLVVSAQIVPLLIVVQGFWQVQRGVEYREYVFELRATLEAQLV